MNAGTRMEAWDQLVADPRPHDHIVQLYQEKAFLNRAVCRFVGAGLANGEGIILVSTAPHWTGFHAYLEDEGVNVSAARKRGQLTVVDADARLPRFIRNAMRDPDIFPGDCEQFLATGR